MGNAIVQVTQQTVSNTFIDTYTNFKQLALSKDGTSHYHYFARRTIRYNLICLGQARDNTRSFKRSFYLRKKSFRKPGSITV